MATVHVFVASGRFASQAALQAFVTPTYSEDGDRVDSPFMREVKFTRYEPMCIESIHLEVAQPLGTLLADTSYYQQWLSRLGDAPEANSAVCVFSPNVLARPQGSSLTYCGAFSYEP